MGNPGVNSTLDNDLAFSTYETFTDTVMMETNYCIYKHRASNVNCNTQRQEFCSADRMYMYI